MNEHELSQDCEVCARPKTGSRHGIPLCGPCAAMSDAIDTHEDSLWVDVDMTDILGTLPIADRSLQCGGDR